MSYVNLSIKSVAGFLILVVVMFVVSAVHAQTPDFYVNGSCGNNSWSGTSPVCSAPNGPKLTIQAAINAASDGDTIEVADGTYTGSGNRGLIIAKEIHLRSESNDPSLCIIDCQSSDRAILFSSGTHLQNTVVEGFTITNGSAEHGGGIRISSPATIKNCWITYCAASGNGGGLRCDLEVMANIENCKFQNNSAGASGGGLSTRSRSTVQGVDYGMKVIDSQFIDNTAGPSGGGISCYVCEMALIGCLVQGNLAQGDDAYGGGLRIQSAQATLVNTTIAENRASGETYTANGGAIWIHEDPDLDLPQHPQALIKLVNCLVRDNTADGPIARGGAFLNDGGILEIANSNVLDNEAFEGEGGAYYDNDRWLSPVLILSNSIVRDNEADEGPSLFLQEEGTTVEIRNCNFHLGLGGIAGNGSPSVYVNNFDEDPLFVDPVNDNFNLTYLSPCLNKGSTTHLPTDELDIDNDTNTSEKIPYDLNGNARQVNSSSCVDVGAYENQTAGTCSADITGASNVPDGNVDVVDLLHLITRWGTVGGMADFYPSPCGDGTVDVNDLIEMFDHWGTCSSPEEAPKTIQDCHEKCLASFPGGGNDYSECVDACIQSLCEQELIECD